MEYLIGGGVGLLAGALVGWLIVVWKLKPLGVITTEPAECCFGGGRVRVRGRIEPGTGETLVAIRTHCYSSGASIPADPPGSSNEIPVGPTTSPYDYDLVVPTTHDPGVIAIWAKYEVYQAESHPFDCTGGGGYYCS